ncbi:MAG TPA: flavodoxin [Candidatus Nanoarchaeia archaeon]|nr:flavodoxin [Candidatus Nanoarchaeia archaeon]
MSILVAAYSRDGHTSSVARAIAKELKADLDLIEDKRKRTGIWGYLFAGRAAMFKKRTEIAQSKDPLRYSLVVIGTPTWSYDITPAMRTYLMDNPLGPEGRKAGKNNSNKVAFFCTCGGNHGKVFETMMELSRKPVATLRLTARQVDAGVYSEVKRFCERLAQRA